MGLFTALDDLVVENPDVDKRNQSRRYLLQVADAAPKLLALLKAATPSREEGCEDCAHGTMACHCWAQEARDLIDALDGSDAPSGSGASGAPSPSSNGHSMNGLDS